MNLIRKEVITSLPVSLDYLFSITAAYAQTVQTFALQNLVWREGGRGGRREGWRDRRREEASWDMELPLHELHLSSHYNIISERTR